MTDLLTAHAENQGDKLAVIDDRLGDDVRMLTYAELEQRANRLANVVVEHGVRPGGKVVWCGQNSLGIVVMVNAARKIGSTAVPLNYRLSDEEAAYVVDHSDATVVYVDAEFAPLFERIRDRIPKVERILVFDGDAPDGMIAVDPLVDAASAEPPVIPPEEADRATGSTMIYTSGTTGKPKGALRTAGTDPEQTAALLGFIGYSPDDVYITTGPLYHSGPGGFMGIGLAMGQTIVVQRKFDPVDWLRLVTEHRATTTFSAPTPIRMICNVDDEIKARYDTSSMRVMIANAAPWSFALKQRYVEDFPPESLFEVYGSTELGVNTVMRPEDQMRKPGSCGKEAPMVEIRLYDDDGNIVTDTGPQATGELYVRSASVFSDYYKQHDKFEEDRRDGFQTVGDIAYRDDEGFLFICDRKKDMIISGGMNIYPAEIEAALEQHPDVYEVAVFGIPDDDWGESVHAVIVAHEGAEVDDAAIDVHARAHLANYKIPRSISWMGELPKTGSGKVLKRDLRAPFWEVASGNV
ncbi:class I adenylate-forming enzyme family protein [Ilumatobacter sp.]|uniref:class I adenylate-forming enzyme family protein n=1 Tax=Ilumatobacter sp. TaxID=1967498 RepID=UPI003B526BD0